MTFDPTPGPGRAPGNNLDSQSVRLIVRGDIPLSDALRRELDQQFLIHLAEGKTSLVGLRWKKMRLSDGSHAEISSNSGMHTIIVQPLGSQGTPLADLFFSVPMSFGFIGHYDPKPSTIWRYRGATDAPTTLQGSRVIDDAATIHQHPGNLTWFNAALQAKGHPIVASWWGRGTRYGRLDYYNHAWQGDIRQTLYQVLCSPVTNYRVNWFTAFKPAVWLNGVKHNVVKMVTGTKVSVPVMSCGLRKIEGEGLYLYVVTNDTKLAVYRGLVADPYNLQDIVVAHVFDIDFTVDTTPFSTGNPQWEGLLQPLYFNASCTKLAGLVSVKWNSANNTAAVAALNGGATPNPNTYFAVLLQADLDAGTTVFDASLAAWNAAATSTHTGVETTSEARTTSATYTSTSYAAVDFIGDQLAVALMDCTYNLRIQETGSWTTSNLSKDATRYAAGSWRAYLAYNNEVLGSRSFAEQNVGTVHMEAASYDAGDGFPAATGSGWRQETLSADMLRMATIEGGDLRLKTPVICEFLEVGTSNFYDTLAPNGRAAWWPGWRTYVGGPAWGNMLRTAVTSAVGRRDVMRFSIWKGGVETANSNYQLTSVAHASSYGWLTDVLTLPPFSNSGDVGNFFGWSDLAENYQPTPASGPISTAALDTLLSFTGGIGLTYGFGGRAGASINPMIDAGNPFVNATAFATDGSCWFYQLAPAWDGIGPAPSSTSCAAFVINGVAHTPDLVALDPDGDVPMLAVPVFIDRVPLKDHP